MTDRDVAETLEMTGEAFDVVRQNVKVAKADVVGALDELNACSRACDEVANLVDEGKGGIGAELADALYRKTREALGALERAARELEETCEKNLEPPVDAAYDCNRRLANAARDLADGAV